MGTNLVVKIMELVLFGGFLLHMFYGVFLQLQNWFARPSRYKKENFSQTSFFSKFMIHTAAIITVFLVIHLFDFYLNAKIFGDVPLVNYNGMEYHDLGIMVIEKFKIGSYVVFYIACFLFLAFHLLAWISIGIPVTWTESPAVYSADQSPGTDLHGFCYCRIYSDTDLYLFLDVRI